MEERYTPGGADTRMTAGTWTTGAASGTLRAEGYSADKRERGGRRVPRTSLRIHGVYRVVP
jgi:hypothetical protein